MEANIIQVILLTLYAFFVNVEKINLYLGFSHPVVAGFITGLIFGDPTTGLFVGGSLQLMCLGVASYGGASVPDYPVASMIATALAIMTGQDQATIVAIGITLAVVFTQMEMIGSIMNSFFFHKAMDAADKANWKWFDIHSWLGFVPYGLARAIPVFVCTTIGYSAVEAIVAGMPAWLLTGFGVAGKLLPAVGIAILLRMLPVKEFFGYLLIGFVAVAYLGIPTLGVAFLGAALALVYWKNMNSVPANGAVGGNDDYDE